MHVGLVAVAAAVIGACELFNPLGYLQSGAAGSSSGCTPQSDPAHLVDAIAISAHDNHTCALRKNNQVVCWGLNTAGETGSISNGPNTSPTTVSGIPPASGIGVGSTHSCALADGGVWCWGEAADGQLGPAVALGDFSDHPVAVEVTTSEDGGSVFPAAGAISAGSNFTCATALDGSVWCWGLEDYGEVGIQPAPEGDSTSTPTEVTGTQGASLIASGVSHTCAATPNGSSSVVCWGLDDQLQLGAGPTGDCPGGSCAYVPVVPALPASLTGPVTSLAAGYKHTCLVSSANVYCWGQDDVGQTGVATNRAPHQVNGFAMPVAVSAGGLGTSDTTTVSETCVLEQGGSILCFGANSRGQLGRGTSDDGGAPDGGYPDPAAVSGITNATAVTVGAAHACAIVDCGTVVCWGANDSGQLGNGAGVDGGTSPDSPTPVQVLAPLQ